MRKDNYAILYEAYLQIRAAYDICANESGGIVRLIHQSGDKDARIKFDLIYTAISSADGLLQMLVEANRDSWNP